MPLKGILLGALGVVDPADRPISDVDVLVFGIGLRAATSRLLRAGFRIMDVPIANGYLSLLSDSNPSISLDLHTRLMPSAQGRLQPSFLLVGAQRRDDMFGAAVWVPTLERLAVHTIANIIKDRVVQAHPHTARDLAALLDLLGRSAPPELALTLRQLSLARSAALAVAWANETYGHPALERMLHRLEPLPARRRALHAQLRARRAHDHFDLRSRIAARACADELELRLLAPLLAAADVITWPLRRASLHALQLLG